MSPEFKNENTLRCDCGTLLRTQTPLADGAHYSCSSCASKQKTRFKRLRDSDRNTALLRRLEQFANLPLSEHESEWFGLAQELGLDEVALDDLVDVVHGGKWRDSNAPAMNVRKTVQRRSSGWLDPFRENGQLRRSQIFGGPVPGDRHASKMWSRLRAKSPLMTREEIEATNETLDTVPDEWEKEVLCARAIGLTRDQFLSGVSDPVRRKRAAAWRRLNRNGPPPELRDALHASIASRNAEENELEWSSEDSAWDNYLEDRELLNSCALTRFAE